MVVLLPLVEVIAIELTTPIWIVLLVSMFLHERLTVARVMVFVVGLTGVLIIIRPGFQQLPLGTAVAFLATFGFALNGFYVLVRS